MARTSWIDADSNPDLDAHVAQLEHFTQSMADGQVDKAELEKQEGNLVAAMKAVASSWSSITPSASDAAKWSSLSTWASRSG